MSDKSKITLKWPLIDGVLLKSDTTYLGPTNNRATYIHEVYTRPDGQNTKVTKGVYSDGYRFIDMLTGNDLFIQGYRPDGSINYTVTSDDIKQDQKGPRLYNKSVPKGYTGMEIRRALNILNPFTWPSRIKASLPKDAPGGTEFPAIVVDKKSQTLRYYDRNGEQQLSSIVSTGANKGDITAKAESKTPEGHFTVGSKADNVKTGVFGDNLFMGLSGTSNSGFKLNGRGFGIHGDANRPFQLGRCDSHGCVRVENKNLEELYNLVEPGTNVYIRKKGGTMKLIPRGKFGLGFFNRKEKTPQDSWDQLAQTVTIGGKTYSTANRDEVIALQNYLISLGHNLGVKQGTGYFGKNTKAALDKHFSSNTPVIDNPTYMAQEAIAATKAPDAGLMFNATSIGVPNAYSLSTNAELETAIDTQEKKNEITRQANAEQQNKQQAYEDLWARRNYKAITGEDWHAGIDLTNYTLKAVADKQREFGLTGKSVDGKWGKNTAEAYKAYLAKTLLNMYSDVDFLNWLYERGATESPIANGITTGISAAKAKVINSVSNAIGVPINGSTKVDASLGIQDQLLAQALYLRSQDAKNDQKLLFSGSTAYDTKADGTKYGVHRHFNGGHYTNESDRNLIERSSDNAPEHFLGQYSVRETPDNFVFTDRYDFNLADNNIEGDGWYAKVRRSMGEDLTHGTGYDVEITIPKARLEDLYAEYLAGIAANKYPVKTSVRNFLYNIADKDMIKNSVALLFA